MSALSFRDNDLKLPPELLERSPSCSMTREYVGINGAPKGPLDTGRGIKIVAR